MNRRLFSVLSALALLAAAPQLAQAFDHTHPRFALVLDQHLRDSEPL
ncbi:MAG TPA: hypothetical protein VMN36_03255 [Verrucomicrobiales bacterium]|nr:hypothetical protein [Verrucomicrobiales bacterium]